VWFEKVPREWHVLCEAPAFNFLWSGPGKIPLPFCFRTHTHTYPLLFTTPPKKTQSKAKKLADDAKARSEKVKADAKVRARSIQIKKMESGATQIKRNQERRLSVRSLPPMRSPFLLSFSSIPFYRHLAPICLSSSPLFLPAFFLPLHKFR